MRPPRAGLLGGAIAALVAIGAVVAGLGTGPGAAELHAHHFVVTSPAPPAPGAPAPPGQAIAGLGTAPPPASSSASAAPTSPAAGQPGSPDATPSQPAAPASPGEANGRPHRRPLVLAHRGGTERAPENTMAAFNDAIASRFDYIETDVRHSADGVAFLVHDPTLPRACAPFAGTAVRSLTAAQLTQVRCSGQPLPRLSELVARLRQPDAARISLFPEVKDGDPLGVRDLLAPLGWSRVIVQSADYDALRQLKQASPQVRTCGLIWAPNGLDSALAVTHDCVGPESHLVDAGFVAKAHAAGAVVYPFTVDDPPTIRHFTDLGVDGIITNRPRLARADLTHLRRHLPT
jgi:glycerophosphoryl diester phosphodiesterase